MFKRKCKFCCKTTRRDTRRKYLDDNGKRIIVCLQCAEYAERRAYRKIT